MTAPDHWIYGPGIALELSRQAHTQAERDSLLAPLANGADQAHRITSLRDAMFDGKRVNDSESRSAGHWALRAAAKSADDVQAGAYRWPQQFAPEGKDLLPRMRDVHAQARRIADGVRTGALRSSSGKPYRHIVHLGIGGSDIGPQLLVESLKPASSPPAITPIFLSNLDYHAVQHALASLDAQATMVVVVSKSFATQETMHNAQHLLRWMEGLALPRPEQNFFAVTARTDRAHQWGITDDRVLWFDDSIGGRFSLWGPVSLTARAVLGNGPVDDFIDGGLRMDAHFLSTPLELNLPAVLAAADFDNLRRRGLPTLMVSAYDSRLGLLVPYLKQLWMESLGKRVDRQGHGIAGPACPILWGDVGTNAQHAFFQLLHQGQQGVAIELIGVCAPEHEAIDSHHALLAHLIAQAQALSSGRPDPSPDKSCTGGHPVKLLMLDRFNAHGLGTLIALWEHRVLCLAALSDVNPFDQWGVELGKSIAPSAFNALATDAAIPADAPLDDISRALIDWLKSH